MQIEQTHRPQISEQLRQSSRVSYSHLLSFSFSQESKRATLLSRSSRYSSYSAVSQRRACLSCALALPCSSKTAFLLRSSRFSPSRARSDLYLSPLNSCESQLNSLRLFSSASPFTSRHFLASFSSFSRCRPRPSLSFSSRFSAAISLASLTISLLTCWLLEGAGVRLVSLSAWEVLMSWSSHLLQSDCEEMLSCLSRSCAEDSLLVLAWTSRSTCTDCSSWMAASFWGSACRASVQTAWSMRSTWYFLSVFIIFWCSSLSTLFSFFSSFRSSSIFRIRSSCSSTACRSADSDCIQILQLAAGLYTSSFPLRRLSAEAIDGPEEGPHVEGSGQVDEEGDEAEIEGFEHEVMVAEGGEEGFIGRVAQCEVQVHLQESADGDEHERLEGYHGAETSNVTLEGGPGVAVAAVEDQRPEGQDDEVLDIVEGEFEKGDLLEVRQQEGGEGAEEPGRPGRVQPPHRRAGVVLGREQHQQHGEGHVAGVQDEEPAPRGQLAVEGEQQAAQSCPEAGALSPPRPYPPAPARARLQLVAPEPAEEE